MNTNRQVNLSEYLRNGLLLILLSLTWYLFDQRNYRGNMYFAFMLVFILVGLGAVFLLVRKPKLLTKNEDKKDLVILQKPAWTALVLVVLFFTIPLALLDTGNARFVIMVWWSLICGFLVAWLWPSQNPYLVFVSVLLLGGVSYRVGAFVNEISSSAFSLGWSEGSRIYNASLFLSEAIYGKKMPLPVLHPSRYILQAVPFLFGIKSILIHRLWQVLLWIVMTYWAAWLMAKKLGDGIKVPLFWLSAYLFLFFFQGAVYYHLMVCVIVILLGYQKGKPWRNLIFVVVASVWAGISRINWIPMPALLAVSLYLLDEPLQKKNLIDYLKWPVVWSIVGVAAAFGSKHFYQTISGENPAVFDSAFSSQLIWRRLLPNATFSLGILAAIGIVSLPILIQSFLVLRDKYIGRLHWLREMGLVGILLVFFAGGVLVSLKIGGGGDLHNLDAFLVFLALICLGIISGRLMPEDPESPIQEFSLEKVPAFLLILLCFVPVWFAFMRGGKWNFQPRQDETAKLEEIQTAMDILNKEPGPILFVTERQLLTMGAIEGVEMVPEYEKVFLMEMAMGNNQEYLEEFYRLLNEHHFKAILMEPISTNIQLEWKSFAEENNSYVRNVILPMLMDYQLALSWDNGEINLLIPNGKPELMQELMAITESNR
jgi:hypothetical protein